MDGKIKLKRVDLRLKADNPLPEGEQYLSPEIVIKHSQDLLEVLKKSQVAIFELSTKGQLLGMQITTKRTIETFGPGMAAMLREALLTNCANIIVLEKAVAPEFQPRDNRFKDAVTYAFNEAGMIVLDYIKVAFDRQRYISAAEKNGRITAKISSSRDKYGKKIMANEPREYKLPDSMIEMTDEGILDFPENVEHMTDAIDAVMEELKYKNREHIYVIGFDKDRKPVSCFLAGIGTVNTALGCPGDMMRYCIMAGADSFIVLHNHPSSDPAHSDQDDQFTERILWTSRMVGIEMLDHIIVGGLSRKIFSYAEEGGRGYGFKQWSEAARETKDPRLMKWFAEGQYSSVKLGLLLNPEVDRGVVETLAEDDDKSVREWAKEKLTDMDKDTFGIKGQIESIKQELKVAEGEIDSYGKSMTK